MNVKYPAHPRRRERAPPGPVPKIGDSFEASGTSWFYVHCQYFGCPHYAALPWAPIIERLGADASADRLRAALTCVVCGHRGANISLVGRARHDLPPTPIPTACLPAWVAKAYLREIGIG
jgi:hypothetical protein